jgi:hypothetical protein
MIWKHCNECTYDNACPNHKSTMSMIKTNANLWARAGALGLRVYLPQICDVHWVFLSSVLYVSSLLRLVNTFSHIQWHETQSFWVFLKKRNISLSQIKRWRRVMDDTLDPDPWRPNISSSATKPKLVEAHRGDTNTTYKTQRQHKIYHSKRT